MYPMRARSSIAEHRATPRRFQVQILAGAPKSKERVNGKENNQNFSRIA